jgi:hypothetical protein
MLSYAFACASALVQMCFHYRLILNYVYLLNWLTILINGFILSSFKIILVFQAHSTCFLYKLASIWLAFTEPDTAIAFHTVVPVLNLPKYSAICPLTYTVNSRQFEFYLEYFAFVSPPHNSGSLIYNLHQRPTWHQYASDLQGNRFSKDSFTSLNHSGSKLLTSNAFYP